ncbi:ankyrin repeat-containing domain protein [Gilbertella persicaria]|uniref:Uncharacterized protein n=1 Tax=Rhizopus stolonifer TaxID=4846 RepID=A0A367J433_RHIST|nr:ankyrin repeat-containing domain protein [Gilbertella persicaria]KAI8091286.1 ankyrin repeat-containing domain protein [Gilbertella persicaria]RCH84688.1 hypothetical protein CU098_007830 [Rhizopus stolonifer]
MTNSNSILPSPPSSPIEATPRKRSYSISFIQNETSQEPIKKHRTINSDTLRIYLEKQGSPNTCDQHHYRSLLSWACIGRSAESIEQLMDCNHLDINLPSGPHHTTALHEACLAGFTQGVKLLLQHPDIDVNKLDGRGRTAVHCATQSNHLACLQLLYQMGHARLDLFCGEGRLAIHTAVLYGYHDCVEFLLASNSPIDMINTVNTLDYKSTLELAIVAGYSSTLELLLQHSSGHQKKTGLVSLAVEWNRIECLQLLIQYGCCLDDNSLLKAVQQRKIDMVRALINAGAQPCLSSGYNPSFLYAANHGFLNMIPLLLTLNTSKSCIQQAFVLASTIGLRDPLTSVIVQTLKSLATKKYQKK